MDTRKVTVFAVRSSVSIIDSVNYTQKSIQKEFIYIGQIFIL